MQQPSRDSSTLTLPAVLQPPVGPKWRALRTIAILLKILAWLALIAGVAGAAFTIASGMSAALPLHVGNLTYPFGIPSVSILTLFVAVPTVVGALFAFLLLYALSELILLLITIERNTRGRY